VPVTVCSYFMDVTEVHVTVRCLPAILPMLPMCCSARITYGRMARGDHGLSKVSLGSVMPYVSSSRGRPLLIGPYHHFMGGPPTRRAACSRLLPPWTPHAIRLWCHSTSDCKGAHIRLHLRVRMSFLHLLATSRARTRDTSLGENR
jgi:hypothetical protein